MSIEKKSLISNRIASKKAIVTKPEGSKVASTKTVSHRVVAAPKVKVGMNKIAINKVGMSMNKIAINKVGMSRVALSKIRVN